MLTRAAVPLLVESMKGSEGLVLRAMEYGKKKGLCKAGSLCVVVHGVVEGSPGNSNSLKVLTVPGWDY